MLPGSVSALLAAALAVPAMAQDAPQFLRDREAQIQQGVPAPQPREIEVPRTSITAPEGAEEIVLRLETLELIGRDGAPLATSGRLPLTDLQLLYLDRLGQEVTLAEVFEIARQIEIRLKREGFLFTRVVVPRQDIDQGGANVQITVLGATVEAVTVEEPEEPVGQVSELIAGIASGLVGLEDPRVTDLERVSLLVTDLPGIQRATFVPSPGSSPEFIHLSLNVERDPFGGVGVISHRDSPVIGPGSIGGIGFANTYGPFGASTEIAYFNSFSFEDFPDLEERNTVQLTQRFYLDSATEFSFYGLYSHTEPGEEAQNIDTAGDQFGFGFAVEHPFIRTRRMSLWLRGGIDIFESEVSAFGGTAQLVDDSVRALHLGVTGTYLDSYGFTRADLAIRQGLPIFGASGNGDPNLSRAGADAAFFLIQGEIERDQPLPQNFGLRLRVAGQYSPDALLSSESFSVGGVRFLRGYDPAEQIGDLGFAADAELRYADQFEVFETAHQYELYAFASYGFTLQHGVSNGNDLVSLGGGARLTLAQGPRLELELAQPVNDPLQRTGDKDLRVFGSLIWPF